MAEFDGWAEYYDLVHQGLPGEAEFYVGQAVRLGGETLELGCGTGRLCIAMAMSGAHVTGLDNSEAMLALCREKMRAVGETDGSLALVCGDMANFALKKEFDFIAAPYRAFMHLHEQEEQRSCLRCVRSHLKETGVFILNTWVPSAMVCLSEGSNLEDAEFKFTDEYTLPDEHVKVRHFHRLVCDFYLQRITEEHLLEEVAEDGSVRSSKTLPLVRVWTTPREFDNLVRSCGFRVEALFGDFDCGPMTRTSDEMIWVLRKSSCPG